MDHSEKRVSKIVSKIEDARTDLIRSQDIPFTYEENLEEGLRITFSSVEHHKRRRGVKQTDSDYKRRSSNKKAHLAYLKVLDEKPQIYISFILAVPPPDCYCLDINLLLRHYSSQNLQPEAIHFSLSAVKSIEEISAKHKCDQNRHYQKLLSILYPKGQSLPFRKFSRVNRISSRAETHQRCRKR